MVSMVGMSTGELPGEGNHENFALVNRAHNRFCGCVLFFVDYLNVRLSEFRFGLVSNHATRLRIFQRSNNPNVMEELHDLRKYQETLRLHKIKGF